MDTTVWQAFGLTLLAGLSTGIGSLIALVSRRTNRKFLSVALGFSAGVMIYVSLVEILDEARATLTAQLGARSGGWAAAAAFFGGMLVIALIDRLIPEGENPHEVKRMEAMEDPPPARLLRMGLFTALAIAVHNFPEGLATFVSALQEPGLAVPIVAAIALVAAVASGSPAFTTPFFQLPKVKRGVTKHTKRTKATARTSRPKKAGLERPSTGACFPSASASASIWEAASSRAATASSARVSLRAPRRCLRAQATAPLSVAETSMSSVTKPRGTGRPNSSAVK